MFRFPSPSDLEGLVCQSEGKKIKLKKIILKLCNAFKLKFFSLYISKKYGSLLFSLNILKKGGLVGRWETKQFIGAFWPKTTNKICLLKYYTKIRCKI